MSESKTALAKREHARARRGSILVLALLMMTAGILFGLSFLSAASAGIDGQARALARLRAAAIAEGGLDQTLRDLEDGIFPLAGKAVELGLGEYVATATPSGGGYDVAVVGTCDGKEMHAFARIDAVGSELDLEDTFLVRGNVSGQVNPNFAWGGTMAVGGTNTLVSTSANGRIVTAPAFSNLDIDSARFTATQTLPAGSVLRAGTHEGQIHCLGNLTIDASPTLQKLTGGATVIGTLLVDGSLTIVGAKKTVQFYADKRPVVLLVAGDLIVGDVSTLVMNGTSIVEGSASLLDQVTVKATGSIALNGNLILDRVSGGPWQYDFAIRDMPPPEVSGGPRRTTLVERWRRIGGAELNPW